MIIDGQCIADRRLARDPQSAAASRDLPSRSAERRHCGRREKPLPQPPTFDFSVPEDRLLLIEFPRFARAPEFAESPPHRHPSFRILANWGLTNGINAVMIVCVHGAIHALHTIGSRVEKPGIEPLVEAKVAGWPVPSGRFPAGITSRLRDFELVGIHRRCESTRGSEAVWALNERPAESTDLEGSTDRRED